jgi:outer membrane protein assembly factor BamB
MRRICLLTALATSCAMLIVTNCAMGQNWPQWRGPQSNGLATAKNLPAEWGADKNIAWKVALPGAGWSQPIVWGDKIFITTAVTENQRKPQAGDFNPMATADGPDVGFGFGRRPGGFPGRDDSNRDESNRERPDRGGPGAERQGPGGFGGPGGPGGERRGPGGFPGFGEPSPPPDKIYTWKVMCLDSNTGKVIWEGTAHSGKPRTTVNRNNTYASETPVTDGERVIAYFGNTGLYCYDMSGKPLWSKDLGAYKMQMGWGTGSSPVLHGDRVFIQCDNDEKSFLVALDKKTGDELWRVEREEKSNWSTPYIWKNKQRTELIIAGGTKLQSHNPENGELFWEMDAGGRNSLTPVGDQEYLYSDSVDRMMGGRGPIVAIRVGASGDISLKAGETSNEYVAWSVPLRTFRVSSPLLYDGCLYMLDQQRGQIRCYNAKTGQENYMERLEGAKGFSSSPWASDGKVFCLDETGLAFVLKAGPEFEVLATNKLDETFWSSVAVVGENLLLRGVDNLYCIAK